MGDYRRTQKVVDPRMQLHYLTAWLVASVALILIGVAFFIYFRSQGEIPVGTVRLLIGNGFFILFISLLMGCYAVMHSHRVAGPAYRLTVSLKRMNAGDFGFLVNLRQGDYLTEIAAQVNTLILDLKEKQARLERGREEISALKAAAAGGALPTEQVAQRLESLLEILPTPTAPLPQPPTSSNHAVATTPTGAGPQQGA